jgi:regulator of protease activity HflC (stomatin/prohibitin superfamily)
MQTAVLLVVLVAATMFLALGVRVVNENERVAIIRLGRYVGIQGPGLILTLPLVDRAIRVRMDLEVPGWRSMPAERLNEIVRQRIGF